MAKAILYCDRCAKLIPPGDLDRGQALALPSGALCSGCASALAPEEKALLRGQVEPPPSRGSARRAAARGDEPRPPSDRHRGGPAGAKRLVFAAGLGGGVLVGLALVVLSSGPAGPPTVPHAVETSAAGGPPRGTEPPAPAPPADAPPPAPDPATTRASDAARARLNEMNSWRSAGLPRYAEICAALTAFPIEHPGTPEAADATRLMAQIDAEYAALADAELGAANDKARALEAAARHDEAVAALRSVSERFGNGPWLDSGGARRIEEAVAALSSVERAPREAAPGREARAEEGGGGAAPATSVQTAKAPPEGEEGPEAAPDSARPDPLAGLGELLAGATHRPPLEWPGAKQGTTDSNPVVVDGRPLWRYDRIWPDDPMKPENYVKMPWAGNGWFPAENFFDASPKIAVENGRLYFRTAGPWGGGHHGFKIPALVFIAPGAGTYAVEGSFIGSSWTGPKEFDLLLLKIDRGRKDLSQVGALKVSTERSTPVAGFLVRLEEGQELAFVARIPAHNNQGLVVIEDLRIVRRGMETVVKNLSARFDAAKVNAKRLAAVGGEAAGSLLFDAALQRRLKEEGYVFSGRLGVAGRGKTVDAVMKALPRFLERERPELVRICFDPPEPDMTGGVPDVREGLADVVRAVLDSGSMPILMTAPVLDPEDEKLRAAARAYGETVANVAASLDVPCVDVGRVLNGTDAAKKRFFTKRGALTREGYDEMNETVLGLYRVLERAVVGRDVALPVMPRAAASPADAPGREPGQEPEPRPVPAPLAARGLVANGSFEEMDADGKFAEGWRAGRWGKRGPGYSVRIDRTNPRSGERALELRAFGEDMRAGASTSLALGPGAYELSFWASTEPGKTASVGADLAGTGASEADIGEVWKRVTMSFKIEKGAPKATLRIWLGTADARAWIDDVELAPAE